MNKSQWIEEKMDIWRGAQYEETAEEFIKNSLEEAWEKGKENIDEKVGQAIENARKEEREHIIYVFEHIEGNSTRERILEYIKKLSTKEIITDEGKHTGVFVTTVK